MNCRHYYIVTSRPSALLPPSEQRQIRQEARTTSETGVTMSVNHGLYL